MTRGKGSGDGEYDLRSRVNAYSLHLARRLLRRAAAASLGIAVLVQVYDETNVS